MALVKQLRDDNWSVVCAACCHMALVFAIMQLYIFFKSNFILCLSICFSLTWYRQIRVNGQRCEHVLVFCALLKGAILKGQTLVICI